MVLLVIFVVVTVILLCCVYFVVASLLFYVWLYVCVYVPTCVLYRSGKEERPWPISGAKINNQSIILLDLCALSEINSLTHLSNGSLSTAFL